MKMCPKISYTILIVFLVIVKHSTQLKVYMLEDTLAKEPVNRETSIYLQPDVKNRGNLIKHSICNKRGIMCFITGLTEVKDILRDGEDVTIKNDKSSNSEEHSVSNSNESEPANFDDLTRGSKKGATSVQDRRFIHIKPGVVDNDIDVSKLAEDRNYLTVPERRLGKIVRKQPKIITFDDNQEINGDQDNEESESDNEEEVRENEEVGEKEEVEEKEEVDENEEVDEKEVAEKEVDEKEDSENEDVEEKESSSINAPPEKVHVQVEEGSSESEETGKGGENNDASPETEEQVEHIKKKPLNEYKQFMKPDQPLKKKKKPQNIPKKYRIPKRFEVVDNGDEEDNKKRLNRGDERDDSAEKSNESIINPAPDSNIDMTILEEKNSIEKPTEKPDLVDMRDNKEKFTYIQGLDRTVDVGKKKEESSEEKPLAEDDKTTEEDAALLYRRYGRLPQFLPKRYFWSEEDYRNLGYFWFNGPQGGKSPGNYRIRYK